MPSLYRWGCKESWDAILVRIRMKGLEERDGSVSGNKLLLVYPGCLSFSSSSPLLLLLLCVAFVSFTTVRMSSPFYASRGFLQPATFDPCPMAFSCFFFFFFFPPLFIFFFLFPLTEWSRHFSRNDRATGKRERERENCSRSIGCDFGRQTGDESVAHRV